MKVLLKDIILNYYGKPALMVEHLEFCSNLGITGFGGSGKTNLLKVIAGLEYIDSGEVLFDGIDIAPLLPKDRRIALISSSTPLFLNKTAKFNLEYPLKKHRINISKDYSRDYEWLNLPAKFLSDHQKADLLILRSLIRLPALLLIDEPCGFIDDVEYFNLRLKDLAAGTQIVYASYDADNFKDICNEYVTLKDGLIEKQSIVS